MIPTIETIVEDLIACKITPAQAITWLHEHAATAGACLRDDFAASALQGFVIASTQVDSGTHPSALPSEWATGAYMVADAMLAERAKAQS